MNRIIDALLTFRSDESGHVSVSALVSTLIPGTGEIAKTWVNNGLVDGETFRVFDGETTIEVSYIATGLQSYRDKVAAGNEKAHHTVVAKGTINGSPFVAFPDREGRRLSLKPDTRASESSPVPGLAMPPAARPDEGDAVAAAG